MLLVQVLLPPAGRGTCAIKDIVQACGWELMPETKLPNAPAFLKAAAEERDRHRHRHRRSTALTVSLCARDGEHISMCRQQSTGHAKRSNGLALAPPPMAQLRTGPFGRPREGQNRRRTQPSRTEYIYKLPPDRDQCSACSRWHRTATRWSRRRPGRCSTSSASCCTSAAALRPACARRPPAAAGTLPARRRWTKEARGSAPSSRPSPPPATTTSGTSTCMLGAIYYNEGTSIDVYMVVTNYQEVDTHSVHQCSLFSATIIYRGRENRGDVRSETERWRLDTWFRGVAVATSSIPPIDFAGENSCAS
jgi:hypothetical protein